MFAHAEREVFEKGNGEVVGGHDTITRSAKILNTLSTPDVSLVYPSQIAERNIVKPYMAYPAKRT
jgi:hypothetical protein